MSSHSPEEIDFLKRIGMKNRRVLKGQEREHMLTLLALIKPCETHNNQRTFIEFYIHAGKEYEVIYGFGSEGELEPYIEEITDYDFQQDSTT